MFRIDSYKIVCRKDPQVSRLLFPRIRKLTAESEDGLQLSLYTFYTGAEKYNTELSTEKRSHSKGVSAT